MLTITAQGLRRGLPTLWVARAAGRLVLLVAACAALLLVPTSASAHPLSTTAILLDTTSDQVAGQLQLPIDRLAIALEDPNLTPDVASAPAKLNELQAYVAQHVSAADPTSGAPWQVAVSGGRVEVVDDVDHLVVDLTLQPTDGTVEDFELRYDAIVERLLSHRILVSSRNVGADTYTAVGVLDWQTETLTVPVTGATTEQGFLAAVKLGVHHIAEGADHLLFLVMLLLPAPLLARSGRWARTDDVRHSSWRVVHVVTAFALGHSITLLLGALSYIDVPSRVVESLIACSILVSGVHALRPIVRGGEVWIAAGFGLMHGLAFAALLGQLDLGRGSLVTELLGFNLGIELTQLIVVALTMPSLILLSRTQLYPVARIAIASAGVLLALGWLAERTTLVSSNPLEPVADALVAHPLAVALALLLVAGSAWSVPGWRIPAPFNPSGTQDSVRAIRTGASAAPISSNARSSTPAGPAAPSNDG